MSRYSGENGSPFLAGVHGKEWWKDVVDAMSAAHRGRLLKNVLKTRRRFVTATINERAALVPRAVLRDYLRSLQNETID